MYSFRRVLCFVFLISVFTLLTGCGGGGGGGGSSGGGSTTPTPPSKAFVSDSGSIVVASVVNPNPNAGTLAIDRIISGASTNLSTSVREIQYDSVRNHLYVANGTFISVFSNANTAAGNVAPARTIQSGAFSFIYSLFLDTVNDVLYVGDSGNAKVLVFNNASTANGTLVPDRSLSINLSAGSFNLNSVCVDTATNTLYVAGSGGSPFNNLLLIYDNASTLNGSPPAADHTITFNLNTFLWGSFVDPANDRLFVASYSDQTVMVFDNASALSSGVASPNRTMFIGTNTAHIFVDLTNNRLYAAGGQNLFIIDNASSANGPVTAKQVIAPGGTSMQGIAVAP